MNADEVKKAVILVRPSVTSLLEVGSILLKETKNTESKIFCDEVASYIETLNNQILNWMSEGKHDILRNLASSIQQLLSESATNARLLSNLPSHNQLIIWLDILTQQIAQLLLGDNMAKFMGVLSGKRYRDWRELLLDLYLNGDGIPIRRNQINNYGPSTMNIEAKLKAVDKMTSLGLLLKHQVGPKNVQIELSWAGRRFAQVLYSSEKNDEPPIYMFKNEYMTRTLPKGMQPFMKEDADKINNVTRVAS